MTARADSGGWLRPALALVAAVTVIRLAGLALDRTDLFVDESQYWLWGQSLDFGYYSKPPLIAWVIRAVTTVAGSDAAFWVRFPAPLFHAATALILAALAARLWDRAVAFWVAATYVTLPFTAIGSALISTDTIMAPFFAAALYFHGRLAETRLARFALLTGWAIGMGFLAKYAAIYALAGVGLAALIWPAARIGWRNAFLLLAAFLAVIAPNVLWNLANKLSTVQHTLDNVGWVRGGTAGPGVNPLSMFGFLAAQFGVAGPISFAALLAAGAAWRPDRGRWLWAFVVPAIAIVALQALLAKAYANWAVSAYFGGTLILVSFLAARAAILLHWSFAINAVLCLSVPILTALGPSLVTSGGQPLLARYLGRADLSRQIIAAAKGRASTVVAADRDILADLFYTGRDSGLTFRAPPSEGRPRNYYEQTFPLAPETQGPVLAVLAKAPECSGRPAAPVAEFNTAGGAFRRMTLAAYLIEADCARTLFR